MTMASGYDRFLAEIEGQYDPSRVHFVGRIDYDRFLTLLQLSKRMLSVPSCSAESAGGDEHRLCRRGFSDRTRHEVLQHEHNGLLVDFFSPQAIAEQVNDCSRPLAQKLGSRPIGMLWSTTASSAVCRVSST